MGHGDGAEAVGVYVEDSAASGWVVLEVGPLGTVLYGDKYYGREPARDAIRVHGMQSGADNGPGSGW